MGPFPHQITIALVVISAGAIIAGSASSVPAHRRTLEVLAGVLLIAGLTLLGILLLPLAHD